MITRLENALIMPWIFEKNSCCFGMNYVYSTEWSKIKQAVEILTTKDEHKKKNSDAN